MARKIPPLAALRAFDAVARHGSLRGAGDELCISISAISHQVKSLEEFLKIKLFTRDKSGMQLTEAGVGYCKELERILDSLETATSRVSRYLQRRSIAINAFPSFAELWLIPRLPEFHRAHEDVQIRIVSQPEEAILAGSDIDVAIRYAATDAAPPRAKCLIEEEIMPVCAPAYLEQRGRRLTEPDDICDQVLISSSVHPDEWTDWCAHVGVSLSEENSWLEVDSRAMVLTAARSGIGLAMARLPYANSDLRDGTLASPFPMPFKTGYAYYLEIPERSILLEPVTAFRDWIVDAIGRDSQTETETD